MGKQPSCWNGESKAYYSDVKCSYLREVPTPTMEGWLYTLQSSQAKMTAKQKGQSTRLCSLKEWGCAYRPPKTIHLTIKRDSH